MLMCGVYSFINPGLISGNFSGRNTFSKIVALFVKKRAKLDSSVVYFDQRNHAQWSKTIKTAQKLSKTYFFHHAYERLM